MDIIISDIDCKQGYFKNITKTQQIIQSHCISFNIYKKDIKILEIYKWLNERATQIPHIPTPFVYDYLDIRNTWAERYSAPKLTIWISNPNLLIQFKLTWC